MSYFAEIVDGKVARVIVAEADYIGTQPGVWVETARDGSIGGKFAGVGDDYVGGKFVAVAEAVAAPSGNTPAK